MSELRVDRDVCMGSGQCLHYAGHTFDLDEDSIAVVVDATGDPESDVDTAITECPTQAISRS
jgi:ferredoxin